MDFLAYSPLENRSSIKETSFQANIAGSNVWLSHWSSSGHSNASSDTEVSRDVFLAVYGAFGLGQGKMHQCLLEDHQTIQFTKTYTNYMHFTHTHTHHLSSDEVSTSPGALRSSPRSSYGASRCHFPALNASKGDRCAA